MTYLDEERKLAPAQEVCTRSLRAEGSDTPMSEPKFVWILWEVDGSTRHVSCRAITTTEGRALVYKKTIETEYADWGRKNRVVEIEKAELDHLYGGTMLSSLIRAKREEER